MTATPKAVVAFLLLASLPGGAAAQCVPSMSINQCWDALDASARAASAALAESEDASRATAVLDADTINTGGQSGGEGAATDDFNPKMQVSADTLDISGDDGGGLALSWADIVFGSDRELDSVGQHHKLVVKLQEAELFEPLANAITDAAVREDIEESLGDFDDVVVDFRLSLDSRRYGRDIQRHSDLIDDIQRATLQPLTAEIDNVFGGVDRVDEFIQRFGLDDDDFDQPMSQVLDSNQVLEVVGEASAASAAHAAYTSRYAAAVRDNGLFDLVDLVNNQPQLTLSIESRVRDDLVGPDQSSLKFSYELGRANVNAFRRYQERQNTAEVPLSAVAIMEGVAAAAQIAATANPTDAAAVAMAANGAALAAAAADPRVAAEARAVAAAAASSATAMPRDGAAAARAATDAVTAGASRLGSQPCASTVVCLKRYIEENRDSIRQGDRLAFSLAFVDKDDFRYDSGGVFLEVPAERSLVAQLSYGRYLGRRNLDSVLGGRRSRIDFTASFEDVKDDPARQNRSVANVTFAQEISQGLFLTVGMVWANKPEYRGVVEEELSARAGINYKLAPQ
jgi:hypothetical protein